MMKTIRSIFIAVLLIPMVSAGQTRVSMSQLGEVMGLQRDGQTEKALSLVRALHESARVHDSVYTYLVLLSAQLDGAAYHCEEAIRDNEELIKLSPAVEPDAQMYIGQFRRLMGDWDGSIAAYARALALDSTNEAAYNDIANTYNSAGRYRDAIRTLDSSPGPGHSPIAYYQYSVAYFHLHQLDSAKRCLNRYLADSASLTDFGANKLAAEICEGLGLKKVSCEFINKAMDILNEEKTQKRIDDAPARMRDYYFYKDMVREIDQAKELMTRLCGYGEAGRSGNQ